MARTTAERLTWCLGFPATNTPRRADNGCCFGPLEGQETRPMSELRSHLPSCTPNRQQHHSTPRFHPRSVTLPTDSGMNTLARNMRGHVRRVGSHWLAAVDQEVDLPAPDACGRGSRTGRPGVFRQAGSLAGVEPRLYWLLVVGGKREPSLTGQRWSLPYLAEMSDGGRRKRCLTCPA